MPKALDPFRFVLIALAGWMNRHQLQIIDPTSTEKGTLMNADVQDLGGQAAVTVSLILAISW